MLPPRARRSLLWIPIRVSSVFHPWLENLLLRYVQGRVFDRWRKNKPEPAFRISSPSPRFGRSRLSFKSGTYCRPVPKRKCRVPGQVVEFPSGEGDRHHGRDQSKADKRSGKVDVVCRPASKAFCPTHGVCRYPGRRLETPGGRAFRQVKRSGSRCQTSDGGCRRRTENPPPSGVGSINTRGGSITWSLIWIIPQSVAKQRPC